MDARELRPRDGEHLAGRVELHRAASQRDHGLRQRQIARLKLEDVTQHLGLAVMRVEDRMREISAGARNRRFEFRRHIRKLRHADAGAALLDEALEDQLDIRARRRLIERDADLAVVEASEIHAAHLCRGEHGFVGDADDVHA